MRNHVKIGAALAGLTAVILLALSGPTTGAAAKAKPSPSPTATIGGPPPTITVDPVVTRTGTNSALVTGTYTCAPSQFQSQISIDVTQISPTGAPIGGDGGANVTCTGAPEPYAVEIYGTFIDGPGTVHAVISQTLPAATGSYDGPVTVV